jgi:ABC-2 type transport system ATP-binding protein
MADHEASVSVRGLSKTYEPSPGWMKVLIRSPITHPIVALDTVTFEVGPGEICAIVGPNGAGKTTLFRILVGLTTPSSGSASVMGLDAEKQSLSIRRLVGWMPTGDRALFMRQTCYENLRFHGRLRGLAGRALRSVVGEVLELVGLSDVADHSVTALSAGMRSRLQLAWAMLDEPRILILDEPTSAVDPVAAYELLNMIIRIVESRKLAALISSHRLDEIEALHSHVVLLNSGSLLFNGDLDDLRRQLDRPHLELDFGSERATDRAADLLKRRSDVQISRLQPTRLRLIIDRSQPIGGVLSYLDGMLAEVVHVAETKVPLRDLLAEVYGLSPRREEAP